MMPNSRPDPAWGLVLAGAAAAFFAFANPVARLPLLVLGLPLCLNLLAVRAASLRAAFRWCWGLGACAASASLYWIALPVHDYGYLPWILAVPCVLALGSVLGLYTGLYGLVLAVGARRFGPLAQGVLAGLAWVGLEMLRGWLFSGFPWLPLAAALVPWTPAVQAAGLVGAYTLSGLLAACGVWLGGPGLAPRLCALVLGALIAGYGLLAASQPVNRDGTVSAGMVQGNVEQAAKWDPKSLEAMVLRYTELSDGLLRQSPDVLIWPETALTFFVQDHSAAFAAVTAFARRAGVPLVTGAPGYTRKGVDADVFNRAYLITGAGLVAHYDKEHLVPFGEYAPFGKDIPFLSALLQGVGAFTPGTATAPLHSGRLAMGMLICYESIFPELAQQRVEAGANVLVNISNDAWFGNSSAPRQHIELAALRAVEQNRFLLRATNTGITALIDPKGRIIGETGLFQEAAAVYTDIGLVSEKTFYHRIHGFIEAAAILAALAMAALAYFTTTTRHDA